LLCPFLFPNFFQQKLTKDEFEVRFKFIQVFHSLSIEKEFLSSYSSIILNQRVNNIQKYVIQVVQLFKEQNFIQDNYKIISNGYYSSTKELTASTVIINRFYLMLVRLLIVDH